MQYTYNMNAKRKPARNNDGVDDDDKQSGLPLIALTKKPYREFAQTFSAQHIHFYISESIGAPAEYVDMIHAIASAGPSDVISIHLNTPGGQLDTGVQLVNAMQNSQAKIITCLEGSAYSLGTLIFLAGDEMVVNDNCMMMFHNFNGGLIGKGNELKSELEATIKWFEAMANDIYIPFITEEEMSRIVKGEDMWMQSPEIRTRLEVMAKQIQADTEAMEAEAQIAAEDELLEAAAEIIKARKEAAAAAKAAKADQDDQDDGDVVITPRRGRGRKRQDGPAEQ